ncbi:MAG: response regulator, partial [Methanosarcinales archaeon]
MTKKEKILIVECEESMQKFLRDILIKEGYEIAMASNGLDAKEKLQKEKIDLALVDLRMRPESGKELIEYIHNEVDPDIVNIIITGYPEDWSPTNATDQHVYHYFKKEELDSRDLIKVVKNGLEFRKLKFIEKEASAAAMAETAELYNDLLSKDITNYNQSIMSYLGLLKKTNLDEKQKKYVDIALTQVKNSVELISDIQKLSKIGTKDLSNALKTLKIDREHIFLKQIDSLMDKYIQFGDISLIKSGIKNSLNRLCDTSDVQAVCLIDMSGTVLSSCQGP